MKKENNNNNEEGREKQNKYTVHNIAPSSI